MLLAMDFGGTFVKHCLIDEETGELTEQGQYPAPLSEESFVSSTGELYQKYRGKVKGVAISMPGVLNTETGFAFSAGAYSGALGGKNIYDLLRPVVDVPVTIENDAKAAILAEQWRGALQGINTGAACIIGSGLGGGIIMDGKIRKGSHFASGEISGLLMEAGKYGMGGIAGGAASMSAFLCDVARAKGLSPADFEVSAFMLPPGTPPSTREKKISGKEVFEWIDAGDEETVKAYEKWLEKLVFVLFNMKMMLDPETIVIGGGVSRNPRLIEDVRREYQKAVDAVAMFNLPETKIEVCKYSSDANMVGAVYNWLLWHA